MGLNLPSVERLKDVVEDTAQMQHNLREDKLDHENMESMLSIMSTEA